MNDLRPQLDRAKAQYDQLKYPGDLASDVLPSSAGRIWPTIVTIATLAVAAMIAVAIWMNVPSHTPSHTVATNAPASKSPDQSPVVQKSASPTTSVINEMTDFPAGVTIVPTMDSMGLSEIPTMPSLDDMMKSATSTTQEAS
jgi:hypothetical protein